MRVLLTVHGPDPLLTALEAREEGLPGRRSAFLCRSHPSLLSALRPFCSGPSLPLGTRGPFSSLHPTSALAPPTETQILAGEHGSRSRGQWMGCLSLSLLQPVGPSLLDSCRGLLRGSPQKCARVCAGAQTHTLASIRVFMAKSHQNPSSRAKE